MKKLRKTTVIVMICFIIGHSAFADIIHVPNNVSTIQEGLIAATEGDTVLVAPGTYVENLFWPATNGITLLSEAGAESTIIDGFYTSMVIYIYGVVTIETTTVIDGFTLQHGRDETGGIACLNASPLVKNCIIENNEGDGCSFTNSSAIVRNCEICGNDGFGIKSEESFDISIRGCKVEDNNNSGFYFSLSSGNLTDCLIANNMASEHGGGIYCTGSTLSFDNLTITNNTASNYGGGILCGGSGSSYNNVTINGNTAYWGGGIYCGSSTSFENVTITNNTATGDGGGIYSCGGSGSSYNNVTINGNTSNTGGGIFFSAHSNVSFHNLIITGNTSGKGGGIFCHDSSPSFHDAFFTNNTATNDGGGIYCFGCNPSFDNVFITKNTTTKNGGGVYCHHSSPSFEIVTITNNTAFNCGGGIYCYESSPNLENVTITLNQANLDGTIYCTDNSNPSIEHCTITENSSQNRYGIYTKNSSEPTVHFSNIMLNGYGIYNADPLFMIDASNCFWGDATGPYHEFWNPGGIGDSVNQYVNPIPYLIEADTTAPPIPPYGLDTIEVGGDFFTINWQNSPIGDLAGYKVYFNSDSSGFPYANMVDVGIDTTYTFSNLTTEDSLFIAVTCYDNSGEESWYSKEIEVTFDGVGIDDNVLHLHKAFYLSQNHPNPFNYETTISFSIPKDSKVELSIYNITGQKIKTLANENFQRGYHKVVWNGKNERDKLVSSGIYIYKLETDNFYNIKKAILLK